VARLHLGLILPNYGEALAAERLASAAATAEEAGFDSGWVTDHLIVPTEHAPVYGTITEALVSRLPRRADPATGAGRACPRCASAQSACGA